MVDFKRILATILLLAVVVSTTSCSMIGGFYGSNDTEDNTTSVNDTINATNHTNQTFNKPDLTPDYLELDFGYYDLNKLSVADSDNNRIIRKLSMITSGYDLYVLESIPVGSEKLYEKLGSDQGFETIISGETVILYDESSGLTEKKFFERKTDDNTLSTVLTGELQLKGGGQLNLMTMDLKKEYAEQAARFAQTHSEETFSKKNNTLMVGTTYTDCYYYDGGSFKASDGYKWYPELKHENDYEDADTTLSRDACAYNTFITRLSEDYNIIGKGVDNNYLEFEDSSEITSFKPIRLSLKIFIEEEQEDEDDVERTV